MTIAEMKTRSLALTREIREYRHTEKRRHPWPVWEHPAIALIITQSPRGPFHIYNGLHCVARNINGFLRARLAVGRIAE